MEINITLFLQVWLISVLAIYLSRFLFSPLQRLIIQRKERIIHIIRQIQSKYTISRKIYQDLLQDKLIVEKHVKFLFKNKRNQKIQENFDSFQKIKIKIFMKFREQMNHINMKNNEIKAYFLNKTNQFSSKIFCKMNNK